MTRFGIRRPRNVALGDTRSPMLRLLADCNRGGMIQVDYEQQWKTLGKAMRLGYVDDNQYITPAGIAWVAAQQTEK